MFMDPSLECAPSHLDQTNSPSTNTSPEMDKEESLMHVLTRLSLSVEEAMKQKHTAEERLVKASEKVNMLSEANEALMKHVASLEARNDIIVNGLLKIVDTVDRSCKQLAHVATCNDQIEAGPASNAEDRTEELYDTETIEEISAQITRVKEETIPAVQTAPEIQPEIKPAAFVDKVLPDQEPQSAELRSLRIDPLVNSRINDYAVHPEMLHANGRRRSSNMRSGRLRSSRLGSALRRSSGLLRRRRTTGSYGEGADRRPRGAGMRFNVDGIPHQESSCGCFLQSIFGCRH